MSQEQRTVCFNTHILEPEGSEGWLRPMSVAECVTNNGDAAKLESGGRL
jgi:hypothetical protein